MENCKNYNKNTSLGNIVKHTSKSGRKYTLCLCCIRELVNSKTNEICGLKLSDSTMKALKEKVVAKAGSWLNLQVFLRSQYFCRSK